MSKHKTPQEKKRDSLEHDRRNAFGQSDKASRRLVPLRKAWAERAHRKSVHQALQGAHIVTKDDERLDEVDEKVASSDVKLLDRFEKVPDMPLGEILEQKKSRGGAPNAKHVRRVRSLDSAVRDAEREIKEARAAAAAIKRATRERGSPSTGDSTKLEALRQAIARAKETAAVCAARLDEERRALAASTAEPVPLTKRRR